MSGPWILPLRGEARVEIAERACVAVVGPAAAAHVGAWGDTEAAAILVPDAQEPLLAGWSVADQIAAALGGTRRAALDRAVDLLERADVSEPHRRVRARPHQLTAVDRQRAQLALVLARDPALLVAEDPSAGLVPDDAAALLATLRRVWVSGGFALVVGTGDLTDAERVADELIILDADDGVRERRRRVTTAGSGEAQASSTSSPSSSSST
ncbi:MAG TPA: hypothetical protein VFN48_11955 [Solirubrobacteraceae bacterium]|nr:hypothetical protein [Solirubrobacteraceae bacterium]